MSLRRLRLGEIVALAGAICVVVALTLPWYEYYEGKLNAWDTFGLAVVLIMVGAIAAFALVFTTVTERSPALPVATAVWSTLLGMVAFLAALIRLVEHPHDATSLCAGAWLAFAGTVLITAGSWISMGDERTHLYPPADPPPREPPLG